MPRVLSRRSEQPTPPQAAAPRSTTRRTGVAGSTAIRAGLTVCLLAGLAVTAACGVPPELRPKPGSSVPQPSPEPSLTPQPVPSGEVPPPGQTAVGSPVPSFAEEFAVSCNGYPSGNQVIALVRRAGGLLPRNATAEVSNGPLCAGTWQYTVLAIPRSNPLLVISRGTPGHLTLVAAGTDVCSIPVRTGAPAGIRNAALCPEPTAT